MTADLGRVVLIGVAGDSGCGKSTFLRRLTDLFGEEFMTVICLDDYHSLDRKGRKAAGVTALNPKANNFDLMYEQIKDLKEGKAIDKPIYNHETGELDPPARIEPNKVVRAVVGHLMAVGNDRYGSEGVPGKLSEYFLNEKSILPPEFGVYCWVYPYRRNILIRDAGMCLDFPSMNFVFFWLIKYFPVAFLVTYEEPDSVTFKMPNLTDLLSEDISKIASLSLELSSVPKQNWPEAPMRSSVVLYSQDAYGAHEKSK